MGGPQKTPLKEVNEAKAYYIRCLTGIPACVWERFDGQLIKAILDALSMNVRQNMPSQLALAKRVCREMREANSGANPTNNALPSTHYYLAYQIHLDGEEVPQSHLRLIAARGYNWLLTWDSRIKPPVFDTESDEAPADREDWNRWKDSQRTLINPTRDQLYKIPVPARHFRTATLKNLEITGVTNKRIHWVVENVPLGQTPTRIAEYFSDGIPHQPSTEVHQERAHHSDSWYEPTSDSSSSDSEIGPLTLPRTRKAPPCGQQRSRQTKQRAASQDEELPPGFQVTHEVPIPNPSPVAQKQQELPPSPQKQHEVMLSMAEAIGSLREAVSFQSAMLISEAEAKVVDRKNRDIEQEAFRQRLLDGVKKTLEDVLQKPTRARTEPQEVTADQQAIVDQQYQDQIDRLMRNNTWDGGFQGLE